MPANMDFELSRDHYGLPCHCPFTSTRTCNASELVSDSLQGRMEWREREKEKEEERERKKEKEREKEKCKLAQRPRLRLYTLYSLVLHIIGSLN